MKLFISCGDINGIGLETFIKAIESMDLTDHQLILGIHPKSFTESGFNTCTPDDQSFNCGVNTIRLYPCFNYSPISYGTATRESALMAIESLEIGIKEVFEQRVDALITLPISKSALKKTGWNYAGQTEMIAAHTSNAKPLMILFSGKFRVALATIHVPVANISSMISVVSLSETITLLHESLQKDWLISSPNIAVLGLNPHSGEEGNIGHEEQDCILPAIEHCQKNNIIVSGPYSADAFFARQMHHQFDAVLAMYHDQGLIPLKMESGHSGVNATMGLPIVRTSPDHGTAFDIAGKNCANPESTKQAILSAITFVEHRLLYKN